MLSPSRSGDGAAAPVAVREVSISRPDAVRDRPERASLMVFCRDYTRVAHMLLAVDGLTLEGARLADGNALLHCDGDVDGRTVPAFRTALDALCAAAGRALVIDLTRVTVLGRPGLHAAAAAGRRLAPDTRLVLVTSSTSVLVMLRVTGLDALLPVFATTAQAADEVSSLGAVAGSPDQPLAMSRSLSAAGTSDLL